MVGLREDGAITQPALESMNSLRPEVRFNTSFSGMELIKSYTLINLVECPWKEYQFYTGLKSTPLYFSCWVFTS